MRAKSRCRAIFKQTLGVAETVSIDFNRGTVRIWVTFNAPVKNICDWSIVSARAIPTNPI